MEFLAHDANVPAAILRNGLIPSAPIAPRYAVSIRALETFRVVHLRCPYLSIDPYVKALCDIYGTPCRPGLRKVFSKCFDLYLRLRDETRRVVEGALERPHGWRLKNACAACTYKLEDEAPLQFSMLVTMDGNESLKRVSRQRRAGNGLLSLNSGETSGADPGEDSDNSLEEAPRNVELPDTRSALGDYYISREDVNKFEDDNSPPLEYTPSHPTDKPTTMEADGASQEENPCEKRWKNMKDGATAKVWGVFEENGIFLSLCRHGYTLTVADLVRSGEQWVLHL